MAGVCILWCTAPAQPGLSPAKAISAIEIENLDEANFWPCFQIFALNNWSRAWQ
jgi:hypothetical protein